MYQRRSFVVALFALCTLGATDASAFRLIQNLGVGRTSSGSRVECSNANGFVHWTTTQIAWRLNPANQGNGKATALQAGLTSWNNVAPATYVMSYAGTTSAAFVTDGINTAGWWSSPAGCGSCLAITALVLGPGQEILEVDVAFNNAYTWTTTGGNYDTQAIWAHEAGHALGIHHTEVKKRNNRPTMYASYFGVEGRTLETDDTSALNCVFNRYPPVVQKSAPSDAASQPPTLSARWQRNGAVIRLTLPSDDNVDIQIFDVAGRRLTTLVSGQRRSGVHEIAWDGRTTSGNASSGVYYARLTTSHGRSTTSFVLLR